MCQSVGLMLFCVTHLTNMNSGFVFLIIVSYFVIYRALATLHWTTKIIYNRVSPQKNDQLRLEAYNPSSGAAIETCRTICVCHYCLKV